MESHLAKDRALLSVAIEDMWNKLNKYVESCRVHNTCFCSLQQRETDVVTFEADPKKMHIYSAETPVWTLVLWFEIRAVRVFCLSN